MKMRKSAALLLALLIVICLVACAAKGGEGGSLPVVTGEPASSDVSSADSSSNTSSANPSNPSSSEPSSSDISSSDTSSTTPPIDPPTPPEEPERPKPLDPLRYYGYENLTDTQKAAYEILALAVQSMPSGYIDLGPATEITERDAHHIAVTLKNDRPDIFWLPYAWSIGELPDGDMAILFINEHSEDEEDIESLTATYIVERAKKATMQAELRESVDKIKSKVTATDPYEIELQLHDILCELVTYSETPDILSYTAYGALVRGDAVCEGYTRAMQLLLYEFGIRSIPVVGFTHEPHMWNLVEINDKWYHLDLTFDDHILGTRHEFFNLTDPGISFTRVIEPAPDDFTDDELFEGKPYNFMLPVCNSTDAWYFSKTGFSFEGDIDALAEFIINSDAEAVEITGWNEEIREPLLEKLTVAGFDKASVQTEGSWAKIFKATTENTEE